MQRTVLITGASRGIGKEFVKHYKNLGWKVIATARDTSGIVGIADEAIQLDVTNPASISNLSSISSPIHLLINNAGIISRDGYDTIEKKTMMDMFDTNAVGPLMVAKTLHKNLVLAKASSEGPVVIANITSRMGSIDDNTSGGYYAYRASKAALNAITKSMAHDLKAEGVNVVLVHPGYVSTDMTSFKGNVTTEASVAGMADLFEKASKDDLYGMSGVFYHYEGHVLPW